MKKIALFLAMILVMSVVALVPVSAESNDTEILKGTPVLDGELDDAYLASASCNIVEDKSAFFAGIDDYSWDAARCYVLWDENYIYFYISNADTTPNAEPDTEDSWARDGGELLIHDGVNTDVCEWVTAYVAGEVQTDNVCVNPADVVKASKQTNEGWSVEVAVPYGTRTAGATIGFWFQVCDAMDEYSTAFYVARCDFMTFTLSDKPAVEAPSTGDNALVAVIALVVTAGAALVVSKKR